MDIITGWIAGIVMSAIVGKVIPKLWRSAMVFLRKDVKAKAQQHLKDPEVRAWIAQGIALAQKAGSKDSSIDKLKMAGNWLKAKIPGPLDDQIIDCMIELMIEEIKKDIDLG